MFCKECQTITNHIFDVTFFWLYLPTSDGFAKVNKVADEQGYTKVCMSDYCIRLAIPRERVTPFLTALMVALNGQELANTNMVTTEVDKLLPDDLGRVLTADIFIHRYQSLWVSDALEAERYETWFQPIYKTSGGMGDELFAYEGLFRMRDEKNVQIPPGHVFHVAGKSDLLYTLDLAARHCAVEAAARAGLNFAKIFINFNPSSVYDPAYCLRTTVAAVTEKGLEPKNIVFELTETHAARDKAHLKSILDFYRMAGFGIALDDIGSGWSSLNMLHEMRPDYVKIDMDLIRDIDQDTFKQVIVKHLLHIARDNGILTVAEGIETEAEASVLRQMGVDYMQGYFFGKPAFMG
ncbi:EAL domain-containing protein [Kordiimonas pumila]|uniref:EAL domain-containing protein n=1 Tax=Kordiimonas pumila TaxID=2161677 RepID=A0ABV7D120_9PROT|nr:EAL domain-containing protein [Kordiimonas pumila]